MFQTAATESAAMQQQYYPWYQQAPQHYPGYAYPYNYYYSMGPVSIEKNMNDLVIDLKVKTIAIFPVRTTHQGTMDSMI